MIGRTMRETIRWRPCCGRGGTDREVLLVIPPPFDLDADQWLVASYFEALVTVVLRSGRPIPF